MGCLVEKRGERIRYHSNERAKSRKVRDGQGYWHSVEVYSHEHVHIGLCHGICPEGFRGLYPEDVDSEEAEESSEGN